MKLRQLTFAAWAVLLVAGISTGQDAKPAEKAPRRMSFTSKAFRNLRHQIHSHHEFEPIPLLDGSLNGTGHRVRKYTDRESRSDVAHVDPSLRDGCPLRQESFVITVIKSIGIMNSNRSRCTAVV